MPYRSCYSLSHFVSSRAAPHLLVESTRINMILEFAGVCQAYRGTKVLHEIDVVLGPGITGLVGPNGAGKTTFLRTAATVMPPQTGQLVADGRVLSTEKSIRGLRRSIGYLPQDFGFDPGMTVVDFVRYAAWIRGVPADTWPAAVGRAIELVDLVDRQRTKLKRLSGGMLQRAGIAWAIVGEPSLVILDEPTVGLDPRQRLQFRHLISSLSGATVLLSTHLIDDIAATCDRVAVLHGGRLRFDGTVEELESQGRPTAPGNSNLERAYMTLLPAEQQAL